MGIINPSPNDNSFVSASGKKYIVYPSLTTKRFEVFEQMQIEMEYGVSVSGFRAEVQKAYDKLNEPKFADAATILNNVLNGTSRIENRQPHPLLMICALFICGDDEDQSRWNDSEAQEKIQDWAGVDVSFFLNCARLLFHRFTPDSNTDFPNTSETTAGDDQGEQSSAP